MAVITFTAFVPVLKNEFVNWDDYETVLTNPHFRGLGWPQLRWMFTTFHMGHFQPLSWLTFALDYWLWETNPTGYHVTNLMLHTANAVLFFFLCRELLWAAFKLPTGQYRSRIDLAAALAALLFSIHPLRVESVAWATERRDVLSGLFFLSMLYAYVRAQRSTEKHCRRTWLILSLVALFLSLMAKATAITAPAVLLLLDAYPLRRFSGSSRTWLGADRRRILCEKIPFALCAGLFAVLAVYAQHAVGALRPVRQYFISYRIGQVVYGTVFYLWKSIFPFNLSPLYELPYDFEIWVPTFLLAGVAALIISVTLFLLRRRWPAGVVCWIYYLVLLAPVLGIAQSGPQLAADRYSYLSCASWAVLIGGGFFAAWRSLERRSEGKKFISAMIITGALVLLSLSAMTWQQTGVWHDTRTLWRHVIAVAPRSSIAHYNLGRSFEDENQLDRARDYYRQAVEINPANPDAHYNLARLLARQGDSGEAIRQYRLALEIRPNDADTHNNLGLLLARNGELEASLAEFQRAVQADPDYRKAFFNMGRIQERQGKLDQAIQNYRHALKLSPNEFEILVALGDALLRNGEPEEAVSQLQKAVTLKPDLPDAHAALARTLVAQGKKIEAEWHYQEALRLLKVQKNAAPSEHGTSR